MVFSTLGLLATASQAAGPDRFGPERSRYQQASIALETGDMNSYRALKQGLRQYPLYPYLEYAELQRSLSTAQQPQIDEFLDRYGDTLLAQRLQRRWLQELASRNDWSGLLKAESRLEVDGNRYQCLVLRARLNTGDRKSAYRGAEQMWNVGESQPQACDPLFDSWIAAGKLTSDIAYSRFWKAVDNGRLSLARYADRHVTRADQKAVTSALLKVSANPALLADRSLLKPGSADQGRIAAYGIRQLARRDLEQSFSLWLRDRDRLTIDDEHRTRLDTYFGVRIGKNFFPDHEQRMQRLDPDYRYPEVTEWRIRNTLIRRDWAGVLRQIDRLPQEYQQEDRWRYWRNVAAEAVGGQPVSALKDNFAKLTAERSFYGFLAAETHNLPYDLNDEAPRFDKQLLDRLEQSPPFQRMNEFLHLGQEYPARSEWNHAQTLLDPEERHAAAHVAHRWGWYDQGIRGAISSKQWNDLSIRFPQPYRELFDHYADNRNINRTWAIAIARQESAFQARVKSHAGARGLMQLMPKTASLTAKRYQVPYRSNSQLDDPRTNIALGTAYLSQMLERFNGNRVHATAAYNAGPYRVSQWLAERGRLPLDIWIETIPFDETRNYVQNVLAFGVIYDVRANRKTSMLSPAESSQLALYQP
ncbi:lytic transglycosylase [Marinobacterium nitratireducens]|uniref:Lytic transglycosylase n=1 Tax=Marinobacterium nitratireducens TaxID=518897 RepID=A0A917Z8J2_9GAMM|nr:lytic transglycosylase [Marinobacterium nitratireducens]